MNIPLPSPGGMISGIAELPLLSMHPVTPSDGRWFYAPTLSFKPTFNWTYMVRYINYMDYADSRNVGSRDSVTFEVNYEF